MFETISKCLECGYSIPGHILPEHCPECGTHSTAYSPLKAYPKGYRHKLQAGSLYLGLKLINKVDKKWICFCLWCKNNTIPVAQTNVGTQQSCGCQRSNTLKAKTFFTNGLVNCTCRVCGLTKNYDLNRPGPIVCSAGCAVYTREGKHEVKR